jgi:undecaprenyl phosphate-alpha-L-ara4N flippase subunit ArnF
MRLPHPDAWSGAALAQVAVLPVAVLLAAIAAYAASLLCWLAALRHLPLNRAYPILSLSYVLVYVVSALLPGMDGSFTLRKSLGVLLVLAGVAVIHLRPPTRPGERVSGP